MDLKVIKEQVYERYNWRTDQELALRDLDFEIVHNLDPDLLVTEKLFSDERIWRNYDYVIWDSYIDCYVMIFKKVSDVQFLKDKREDIIRRILSFKDETVFTIEKMFDDLDFELMGKNQSINFYRRKKIHDILVFVNPDNYTVGNRCEVLEVFVRIDAFDM